jgi:hypothetical protein
MYVCMYCMYVCMSMSMSMMCVAYLPCAIGTSPLHGGDSVGGLCGEEGSLSGLRLEHALYESEYGHRAGRENRPQICKVRVSFVCMYVLYVCMYARMCMCVCNVCMYRYT